MLKSTLLKAANAAGLLIKERINSKFTVAVKDGPNDLVTEVDKASEALIMQIIREEFPDHFILSEEIGEVKMDSSYKWIIDPIDGTINFANGIPLCCVSIGLEKDGEMIMGAVYNAMMNEFFFAEKGQGAFLNDQKLRVSEKDSVRHSCLVTGFPYVYLDQINGPLEVFGRLIREGIPVRRLGSAAIDLCWVATGRLDGFYEHKLMPWDSAAGYLMVEEAGGRVTDFNGDSYSPYQHRIVATNGKIHDELIRWINNTHQ
ncbi:MAG: inositol monophosphatase family protein [bacterium]|jgi:myo-inositol-1(or 4)-monophosphatase